MSKLFPFRSTPDLGEREPRLVDLDEDVADEVFDALGSATARTLLLELHDEPRPASELAEAVDTTVQNVQYHLTKLEAAGLVTVVDTWYSESGTEMDVYAPADEALVLFAGEDPGRSLGRLVERLVGALGVLAVGAVAVALAADRWGGPGTDTGTGTPTAGGVNETVYTGTNASLTVNTTGGEVSATASQAEPSGVTTAAAGADPLVAAAAFVCGGLVALAGLYAADRLLG
ncbi:MAG: ArsR/SmtB family transcription factor [Haloarculaceae archaeon]